MHMEQVTTPTTTTTTKVTEPVFKDLNTTGKQKKNSSSLSSSSSGEDSSNSSNNSSKDTSPASGSPVVAGASASLPPTSSDSNLQKTYAAVVTDGTAEDQARKAAELLKAEEEKKKLSAETAKREAAEKLRTTLQAITDYFYLVKPLSTKVSVEQILKKEADKAIDRQYDGPDANWQYKRVQQLRFVNALESSSDEAFIKTLREIDKAVNPESYTYTAATYLLPSAVKKGVDWVASTVAPPTRFQVLTTQLVSCFEPFSGPDSKDTLKFLIDLAKEQHVRNAKPKSEDDLAIHAKYIEDGCVHGLFTAMEARAKQAPKTYADLYRVATQSNHGTKFSPLATATDCQLMISKLVIDEALKEDKPALPDILHVLHRSLTMLNDLYALEGNPKNTAERQQRIQDECGYLRGYLDPTHKHANASHLVEILSDLPAKCEAFKSLTTSQSTKPDNERSFDKALADSFTDTLKAYASLPTIKAAVKSAQEALLASTQKKTPTQKK